MRGGGGQAIAFVGSRQGVEHGESAWCAVSVCCDSGSDCSDRCVVTVPGMVEYSSVMRSTGDHLVVVVEEASLEEHDHTVSKG